MNKEMRKNNISEEGKKRKTLYTILYIVICLNVILLFFNFKVFHDYATSGIVKFKEMKQELKTELFSEVPADKEFAWNSELIPEFVNEDFEAAIENDKYDGIAYTYGENKIQIEEEWPFSEYESCILVNLDIEWSLNNYSIYSEGDKIAIYGYWNDEFRKITVGKEQGDVKKELITSNPEIPIDAKALTTSVIANDVTLVLSQDNYTVSAYKDRTQIGEAVKFPERIMGLYDEMLLTQSYELYMPYVLNDKWKYSFTCIQVASISEEELEEAAFSYDEALYAVRDFASIGEIRLPVFRDNESVKMLVPNEFEKYFKYVKGEEAFSSEDDLNWHWVEIR